MITWEKTSLALEDGTIVDAQAPKIVSASRSTDIPAFYADWFFHRLKVGYSAWTNPFNGKLSYISYQDTRFIVFWSKNPKKLLAHLDELRDRNINSYIQFTLNNYEEEGLEKGVPPLNERIVTFRNLAERLGKEHVIWRFDPLILTDKIGIDDLLHKIEYIGDNLNGYTEKLVFSFADIAAYRKVKSNLEKNKVNYTEWGELQMEEFAKQLAALNRKWDYQLATCGEKIDINKYGIAHNRCIDDDLIIRLAYNDSILMRFLNVEIKTKENNLFGDTGIPQDAIMLDSSHYAIKTKSNKDKGQRKFCGCMVSKDIGEYNTCPHLCEYCYANASKDIAIANFKKHQNNILEETITGK